MENLISRESLLYCDPQRHLRHSLAAFSCCFFPFSTISMLSWFSVRINIDRHLCSFLLFLACVCILAVSDMIPFFLSLDRCLPRIPHVRSMRIYTCGLAISILCQMIAWSFAYPSMFHISFALSIVSSC